MSFAVWVSVSPFFSYLFMMAICFDCLLRKGFCHFINDYVGLVFFCLSLVVFFGCLWRFGFF
jgi:hypothetical protein